MSGWVVSWLSEYVSKIHVYKLVHCTHVYTCTCGHHVHTVHVHMCTSGEGWACRTYHYPKDQ